MKNLRIAILALLISTSAAFSQIEDVVVLSDYEQIEEMNGNDETIYLEQNVITEEFTPIILDPEDKYKLNQDYIYLPTQVTKTFRVDGDNDVAFDRKMKLKYLKPENVELDFLMTKDGIIVTTENNYVLIDKILNKNNILHTTVGGTIKSIGDYTIYLTTGEKIDLKITDYEFIK